MNLARALVHVRACLCRIAASVQVERGCAADAIEGQQQTAWVPLSIHHGNHDIEEGHSGM